MSALRLVFVWQIVFAFLALTRPTMGIELLDDTTETFDRLDGLFYNLMLVKDIMYKRNPSNNGNPLKVLWEDIPEELAEDYMKHVWERAKQTREQQMRDVVKK